jgi:hypothetical protein
MRQTGKPSGLVAAPVVPAGDDASWEEIGEDVDQPAPFFTFEGASVDGEHSA